MSLTSTESWRPPNGIDPGDPVARSLWCWMLSQTWFVRFEEWEAVLESPDKVNADLLVSGEQFLSQLKRLWGLRWHWDGLYSSSNLEPADWRNWHRQFSTWIFPWFSRQDWQGIARVLVARPSDVLWLCSLGQRQEVEAVCAHAAAFAVVQQLLPNTACSLVPPETEPEKAGLMAVHCRQKGRKDDLEMAVRARMRENPNLILNMNGWDGEWLTEPKLSDRLLFDLFQCPKAWKLLSGDERDQLRALWHWMNSPAGVNLRSASPRSSLFMPSAPKERFANFDLAVEPYASIVHERLKNLDLEKMPLFPRAGDWCNLHRHLLGSIYPFAGNFRRTHDVVLAGRSATVQAGFIPFEMEILDQQWRAAWSRAITPAQKLAAIAWSHLRYQRLHPFRDGNGHIGRVWLARQAVEFGQTFDPLKWEGHREPYRNSVTRTMVYNDMKHLGGWLQEVLGIHEPMAELPFRTTPLLQMSVKVKPCES